MKNVRLQMLNGEKSQSSKCYKEETAGHRSKRQWETKYWEQRVDLDKILQETNEDGSLPPNLYIYRFTFWNQMSACLCYVYPR